MPHPATLFAAAARTPMNRGIDTLANLLALTLGPIQGGVLSTHALNQSPEFLTDASTIARRFLALPDRAESAGAMLLRNMVWRVHQTVGDGGATAAVLAQAIIAEAAKPLAAGANAMLVSRGVRLGAEAALGHLAAMAQPADDADRLEQLARTITGEPRLSLVLAELFDLLGPDAFITIEDFVAPYLEREYLEGGRWQARLASPYLTSDPNERRATVQDGAVVLFDGPVREIADIRPLLELVLATERPRLLLVAQEIGGEALTTLVLNHQRKQLHVVAAELRGSDQRRQEEFADLAALTGARPLVANLGDRLRDIQAEALGQVRRAEATTEELIVSGRRDAAAVRERIASLRAQLDALPPGDDDQLKELRVRLGRLAGGAATLKIGAYTAVERAALRARAEQGIRALSSALREGALPGGGGAYLNCIPALHALEAPGEAAYGVAAVARALEAPFRQIVANAGRRDPATALAEARRHGPSYGYDALHDTVVEIWDAGILDPAGALCAALRAAASVATMALTTDALVLKRKPRMSTEP
jgi:chaperonin GroEL